MLVLDVVAVDDEDDIVPIARIVEQFLEVVGAFRKRVVVTLILDVPTGLFTAVAHRPPATGDARFVVDRTGVIAAAINVGLVAPHVKGFRIVDRRTELHARVAVRADEHPFHVELEIDKLFRVLPGGAQNEIGLDRVILGFAAVDDPVSDRPVALQTFPAGQILAVEKADKALGIGLPEGRRGGSRCGGRFISRRKEAALIAKAAKVMRERCLSIRGEVMVVTEMNYEFGF